MAVRPATHFVLCFSSFHLERYGEELYRCSRRKAYSVETPGIIDKPEPARRRGRTHLSADPEVRERHEQSKLQPAGANRVGALEVKLAYFFGQDVWGDEQPGLLDGIETDRTPEGQRLLSAFMRIGSRSTRAKAIRLLESIADASE
jgi:hypothetical protein